MNTNFKKFFCIIIVSVIMVASILSCIPLNSFAATNSINFTYCAHVQDYGWMAYKKPGGESQLKVKIPSSKSYIGTTGESKRMESLEINFSGPKGSKIVYRAHVQDYGWMNWVTADNKVGTNFVGTTGQSKRVEAFQIVAIGLEDYDIKYRVHSQDYGWMNWVTAKTSTGAATLKVGNYAGTVGESKRMEAFEIVIVPSAKAKEKAAAAEKAKKEAAAKAAAEKAKKEAEAKAKKEAEAKAAAKKAEVDRLAEENAKKAAEEAKKVEEAKKAEEERRAAEEAKKAEEERKAAEEAKKAEEERKAAEEAKKAEEERKAAEEAKKAEEERKAAEEAKKLKESHTNHTYSDWVRVVEPTCNNLGLEEQTCTVCGHKVTRTIYNHDLERTPEADVPATCTEMGRQYSKCKLCGQVFFSITPKLGHEYSDGKVVIKEATCTEDGLKGIKCTREGCTEAKETETIEATGHELKEVTVEPTCTTAGSESEVCEKCGYIVKETEIPATGHTFEEYVSNDDATCIEDGTETAKCKNCDVTDTKTIENSKLNHNFECLTEKVEATCETAGKEEVDKCSICGEIIGGATIKATGHKFVLLKSSDSQIVNENDAEVAECTECKCQIQVSGNKVTSFGEGHEWDKETGMCTCGSTHDSTWWKFWKNEESRYAAIWFVGFTCDMSKCAGFNNHMGRNEETVLEGRRGDILTITMEAPEAKEGYEFEGWYQVKDTNHSNEDTSKKIEKQSIIYGEDGKTIVNNSAFVSEDGKSITVPWQDMDKGFEARYVSKNTKSNNTLDESSTKNDNLFSLQSGIGLEEPGIFEESFLDNSTTKTSSEKTEYDNCNCYIKVDYDNNNKITFGNGHQWNGKGKCDCGYCNPESVWWKAWADENNRSSAIWMVGFTADTTKCGGFNGKETTIECRRGGDVNKITMTAPNAKDGYVFDGWYQVKNTDHNNFNDDDKIENTSDETKAYVNSDGKTITVPWQDMDKGFEARYVRVDEKESKAVVSEMEQPQNDEPEVKEESKENVQKTSYNQISAIRSYLATVNAMINSENGKEKYDECLTKDFDNGPIGLGHEFGKDGICSRCGYEIPNWTNAWASEIYEPTLKEILEKYNVKNFNYLNEEQRNDLYQKLKEKGGRRVRKVWFIIYKADTNFSNGFNGQAMDVDSVITADVKFTKTAPNPKEGYKFIGWYDAGNDELKTTEKVLVTSVNDCDKTFEARYEKIK